MEYIVGNISDAVVQDLAESNCEKEDIVTFYTNEIERINYYISSASLPSKIVIRGRFRFFSTHELEICREKHITLSLIIDSFSEKEIDLFLLLLCHSINFNCVFSCHILIDSNERKKIARLVKTYGLLVRITSGELSQKEYISTVRLFQEELFEFGFDRLIKVLDSNHTEDKTIICKLICLDSKVAEEYNEYDTANNTIIDVSYDSSLFYMLESVPCYSEGGMLYLQQSAFNRLQNRILARYSHIENSNSKNEEYDIVFVYANRFRSTVAVPFPPISQYYLNTLVQNYGFRSRVIQCTENNFETEFKNFYGKTKVVGLYCACNNQVLITNIIRYIKANSDIKVIVGGPQTAAFDESFFLKSLADVAIVGEGEGAIVDTLNYYVNNLGDLHSIKNLKFLEHNHLFVTPQREVIKDLDAYPFAKYKRSEVSKYNSTSRIFVLTGRGCPNRCTFCFEGANSRKVRYRSMECVFEEIRYLMNEFPMANLLHVLDDTFTCNLARVYEFCDKMREIRKTRKIEWVCEVHVNNAWNKPELLNYMIESGMRGFQIGLESGSDEVLTKYRKNTSAAMIRKFIDTCAGLEARIFIEGNIIIGGPFESIETIEESLNLCKYLIEKGRGIVELNTLCFCPLPNTDITNHPDRYGLTIHWDEVDSSILAMSSTVTSSQFLTKAQIEKEKKRIDKEVEEKYTYETLRFTSEQVMTFWDNSINQFMIGSRWGAILNKYEHFNNYALSVTFDNPTILEYSLAIFPVRTFENIREMESIYNEYGLCLSGTEKSVLKMCTGKYTCAEIANTLIVEEKELKKIIESLKSKCLVYYSLF